MNPVAHGAWRRRRRDARSGGPRRPTQRAGGFPAPGRLRPRAAAAALALMACTGAAWLAVGAGMAAPAVAGDDGARRTEPGLEAALWLLGRRSGPLPAAPSAPRVAAASARALAVAWNAPHDATDVVGYDLQYRAGDHGVFLHWEHAGTRTQATIAGLVPETAYAVRVRARNAFGAGDWSAPGSGATAAPAPVFAEGAGARRTLPENAGPDRAVGMPVSAAGAARYRLAGAAADAFAVDDASGQIRTRAGVAYDYERRPEYAVTVEALDADGRSAAIVVTIGLLDVDEPPAAPAAPTLQAASSTGLVVRWSAPANSGPEIAGYDVHYRTFGGGDFLDANHEGTATTARIAGLRRGTRYQVRVRATNAEGTGAWSPRGSGRTAGSGGGSGGSGGGGSGSGGSGGNTPAPGNRPPAFTSASSFAVPENTRAVGAVVATDPDRGDDIARYAVVAGADAAYFEIDPRGGALAFLDAPDHERPADLESSDPADAAGNNTYVVVVEATAGTGSRARSARQSLRIRVADVTLEAPTAVTVDAAGSTRLTVRWSAPYNSGPPILGYEVQRRTAGAREFAAAGDADRATVATLTGLRPATVYEVRVRATSAAGPGQWSAVVSGVTAVNEAPAFLETAPVRQVAENAAAGTAVGPPVAASDPNDDALAYGLGGPDANRFAIGPDSGQLEVGAELDHEAEPEHSVRVSVDDGHGGRVTVAVTVEVTDVAEPPPAPVVDVASSTLDSLTVRWTVPAHTGPPVSGYDIRYRPAGGAYRAWAHDGTSTTATIDGLAPSTDHDVQVQAHNPEGSSGWSAAATGRTEHNQAPRFRETAPVRRVAENTGGGVAVGAAVTADDSDGGTLAYSLEGADARNFDIVDSSGQIRTRADVDYDHETQERHGVTVRVLDGQGGSAAVAAAIEVTDVPGEVPAPPAAPRLSAASPTRLAVAWTAPANAGPPIDDYDYRYRTDAAGSDWTGVTDTAIPDTEADIDGLRPATRYAVQVRARNDEGSGGWSPSGSGTTDAGHPDLVASLAVDDAAPLTGTSFTLTVTVHNQGTGPAEATTVRYHRSADATISAADSEIGNAQRRRPRGGRPQRRVALGHRPRDPGYRLLRRLRRCGRTRNADGEQLFGRGAGHRHGADRADRLERRLRLHSGRRPVGYLPAGRHHRGHGDLQ